MRMKRMHMYGKKYRLMSSCRCQYLCSLELGKIDKDVLRITGEAVGTETLAIDRPGIEE